MNGEETHWLIGALFAVAALFAIGAFCWMLYNLLLMV
jgi:hypothetical protein